MTLKRNQQGRTGISPCLICPLCQSSETERFHQDKRRDYFLCRACGLAFVPADQFASDEEEKARYDKHCNSPSDQGYRRFLERMLVPMLDCLSPNNEGLDFGSGPVPALSMMFEEAGHSMTVYDRFYARDPSVLRGAYDFIVACEVAEHLRKPREELDRLWSLLKPGGKLGIMTGLLAGRETFSNWHYKEDFTHVLFFSRQTFKWLANRWKAELTFFEWDVMIFRKKAQSSLTENFNRFSRKT